MIVLRPGSGRPCPGPDGVVLRDAAAARTRIKDLIPAGTSVFTGASETLRLSGIEADINTSGRYQAIRPRVLAMDRAAAADDIRRLLASPDVAVHLRDRARRGA